MLTNQHVRKPAGPRLTRSNTFVVDPQPAGMGKVKRNEMGHYYISQHDLTSHDSQHYWPRQEQLIRSHHHNHQSSHHHTLPVQRHFNSVSKCISTQTLPTTESKSTTTITNPIFEESLKMSSEFLTPDFELVKQNSNANNGKKYYTYILCGKVS